jgi:hypothetical protein
MAFIREEVTDGGKLNGPVLGLEAEGEFTVGNVCHLWVGEGFIGDVLNEVSFFGGLLHACSLES